MSDEKRMAAPTGSGSRIFSLGSAGLIVSIVSARVDVAALTYGTVENRLTAPGRAGFPLDIDEFGNSR